MPDSRFDEPAAGGSGATVPMLADTKFIHYSENTYPDVCLRAPGVWRRQRVRVAVQRRADAVPGEYRRHARRLDRSIHGVTAEAQERGERGPIEDLLHGYVVEGWAFGTFAEASRSVHDWLQTVATSAAQRWREMGARDYVHARSLLVVALYRKWGAGIVRANVWLRKGRLELVGRRHAAPARAAAEDEPYDIAAPGALDGDTVDVGDGFGTGLP